jgi:ABC-type antimicrobial peptide transport system permease subunit
MKDLLSESLLTRRLSTWLLGTFAFLAILLATVGIYGVTSYIVSRRTNEIGLRIALGAAPSEVLRMVVRGGVGVALAGVTVGIVGALALSRVLSGMLFGVTATDPVIFAGVPLLFVAVAAGASLLPARRAAKVDPAIALRSE